MTREELAANVTYSRRLVKSNTLENSRAPYGDGRDMAIVQLADERDAALADVETWKKTADGRVATRASGAMEDAHFAHCRQVDAERERDTAIKQRDRALALLRNPSPADCTTKGYLTGVGGIGVRKCSLREPCWGCERRALLAEVGHE